MANPVPIIMAIAALASLVASAAKSKKQDDYQKQTEAAQEEQRRKSEALALRNAMSRQLGTEGPYISGNVKMPNAPSTTWEDVTGGVSRVVSDAAANKWADQMFNKQQTFNNTYKTDYNYTGKEPYYG